MLSNNLLFILNYFNQKLEKFKNNIVYNKELTDIII